MVKKLFHPKSKQVMLQYETMETFNNIETLPTKEAEEGYLLDQFERAEKIKLNETEIEIVDISPRELKTEVPTFLMPGFSATPLALKDAILRTAESGRRVISAYAPHGIDTARNENTELPEAEMRKLETLLTLIEAKGAKKINVIATSESAIYVTAAAVLYPEKFANIILVEPAGLIGEDSFLGLIKRTAKDMSAQQKMDSNWQKAKFPSPASVGAKSILSNIGASIREIQAISKADIREALQKIHQSGIGISIIHAVDDKVFPMERVQQMVKSDMIDGFYSVEGVHGSIYIYEPYGRIAEMALCALEEKQSKKSGT